MLTGVALCVSRVRVCVIIALIKVKEFTSSLQNSIPFSLTVTTTAVTPPLSLPPPSSCRPAWVTTQLLEPTPHRQREIRMWREKRGRLKL